MKHTEDRHRIRWAWLAHALSWGLLPALLLFPYFGWRHLWVCTAMGVSAAGVGLWEKYRSRLGSLHVFLVLVPSLAVTLAVVAVGSVGVVLLYVVRRPDLVALGGVLSCASLMVMLGLGVRHALTVVRLHPVHTEPPWLRSRVDLATGQLAQRASEPAAPSWQGLVVAFGLNIPLLWKGLGFDAYSFMVVLVPVVNVLVGRIMFAVGSDMTYLWHIMRLEQQQGRRFQVPSLDEVRALRRTFWFAKWLCRAEDLAQPPATPTTTGATRRVRRKLEAARKP